MDLTEYMGYDSKNELAPSLKKIVNFLFFKKILCHCELQFTGKTLRLSNDFALTVFLSLPISHFCLRIDVCVRWFIFYFILHNCLCMDCLAVYSGFSGIVQTEKKFH